MKIWHTVLITFSCIPGYAQNASGPRLSGMASSGTSVSDVWSLQSNPATMVFHGTPIIALAYQKHILSDELNTQSIAALLPFRRDFFGLTLRRYGFSAYHDSKLGLSYAKKLSPKFSLAFTINYHQIKVENYSINSMYSVDAGLFYALSSAFSAGLSFRNPTALHKPSNEANMNVTSAIDFGISYSASNKLMLVISIEQKVDHPAILQTGIEYSILKILSLRSGILLRPYTQHFGFGINIKKITFDVASTYTNALGYSPQISVAYAF